MQFVQICAQQLCNVSGKLLYPPKGCYVTVELLEQKVGVICVDKVSSHLYNNMFCDDIILSLSMAYLGNMQSVSWLP